MSNIGYPGSVAVTSGKRNLLHEEAIALRTISNSDFADPLKIEHLVDFMDGVGAAGEPEYALQLAEMVLVALRDVGEIDSRIGNRVLLSSATNNWLAGNADSALLTLELLLEAEDLLEVDVVRAASVKARIMWSQDLKSESVDFLTSVLDRLSNGSESKASTIVLAAQYASMVTDYAHGLSLIEAFQQEISDSRTSVTAETEQMLRLELAWIHLNLGHVIKAMGILNELGMDNDYVENPKLQNSKAYVSAWCVAVSTGQSLGDAIRDGDCKFAFDPVIVDSQHTIGGAWARVQNGDILGAHNLFSAAAKEKKSDFPAPVALNNLELALEGTFYTAGELGREKEALEALSELQSLQSNTGFAVSVSGLVHGTAFTLCGTGETNARLSTMRALRRRAQFTQGGESILVVRSILAECRLLQEAGLHEQELQLRDYCKTLLASANEEKTKSEFQNDVRIATLTAILGDEAGAEAMLDLILPAILSLYDIDDELTITARYARAVLLDDFSSESTTLEELKVLQQDIQAVFGANSIMNLKANYSIACSLARVGDSNEALAILLEVETNAAYKSAPKEFRRLVVSKVAGLFYAEGKYSRAINWYKLITRTSFKASDQLTQRELDDHVMYGHAQARAGRFKEARSYFENVLNQKISADPRNFDMLVDGRVASAASAESLGLYTEASIEYLAIVKMLSANVAVDHPRLWELTISVARNYELSDDQANAFLHYDEALKVVQSMDTVDEKHVQEIRWRRECCRQ